MPLSRSVVIAGVAAGTTVAVGTVVYLILRKDPPVVQRALHRIRSYVFPARDEGFAESSGVFEPPEKKVLVLGLDGSGKTELLRYLATVAGDASNSPSRSVVRSSAEEETPKPTEGIKVTTVTKNRRTYHCWEVGGGSGYRKYWSHFFEDTDLLVYVVDSADSDRLQEAFNELKKVVSDHRLRKTSLLIVANKQNLDGAVAPEVILEQSNIVVLRRGDGAVKITGASKGQKSSQQFYEEIFQICDSM